MHAYAHAHAVARKEDSTRTTRTTRASRDARARGIRRTAAVAAAALLGLAGLFAGSSPALAHDELVGYSVEVDVADGRATALALHFSNEIMDVGTEIAITGPDGEDLTDGAPTIAGRDVTQPLKHPLPEGDLAVAWRVVSSDGHPISGELTILSAADGTATVGPAGEEEHEHAEEGHAEDGHDHAEDAQEPAESVAGNGDSPVVTGVIVAVVTLAAIAAVAAVVIGTGRRRRAFEEAAAEANAGAGDSSAESADGGTAEDDAADNGGKL